MAAGAVLIALIAVLYENMAKLRAEATVTQDVESLVHFLQDALNNPIICRQAFRTSIGPTIGGPVISWANPSVPQDVGHIEVGSGAAGTVATMGAYKGQILQGSAANPKLVISSITLREPIPNVEGTPARSQIDISGIKWNLISTKVVLKFQVSPRLMPQGLPERTLDVVLGLNPGSGQVGMCYQVDPTTTFDTFCDAGQVSAAGNPDCPTPSLGCQKFYFVQGFDSQSKPLCACEIICPTPPSGPPGDCVGKACGSGGGGGGGGGSGGGGGGGGGSGGFGGGN